MWQRRKENRTPYQYINLILGGDRVVIKDVPPSRDDPSIVSQYVKMTYAFGELLEHWPEAHKGMRDEHI